MLINTYCWFKVSSNIRFISFQKKERGCLLNDIKAAMMVIPYGHELKLAGFLLRAKDEEKSLVRMNNRNLLLPQ